MDGKSEENILYYIAKWTMVFNKWWVLNFTGTKFLSCDCLIVIVLLLSKCLPVLRSVESTTFPPIATDIANLTVIPSQMDILGAQLVHKCAKYMLIAYVILECFVILADAFTTVELLYTLKLRIVCCSCIYCTSVHVEIFSALWNPTC